jgi:hypothetical protein
LGILRLSILAGIQNDEPAYLIRENELVIQSEDVWDMKYSGSSLKIWRMVDGKKKDVFIDLVIKPDVIIIRRMNTNFNGKAFRVRKLRAPQRRQVNKIASRVKQCEELDHELSAQIDSRPRVGGVYDGIDIDALIKGVQRDTLKMRLEQNLCYGFCKQFNWDWPYYWWVLDGVLRGSPVFGRTEQDQSILPPEFRAMHDRVANIKEKYKEEFEELGNVIAEYDGVVWLENLVL